MKFFEWLAGRQRPQMGARTQDDLLAFPATGFVIIQDAESRQTLLRMAAAGVSLAHALQWHVRKKSGYVSSENEDLNRRFGVSPEGRNRLNGKLITIIQNDGSIESRRKSDLKEMVDNFPSVPSSVFTEEEISVLCDATELTDDEKKFLLYESRMANEFYNLKKLLLLEPGASRATPAIVGHYFDFDVFDKGEGGPINGIEEESVILYSRSHDLALRDEWHLVEYLGRLFYLSGSKIAIVLGTSITLTCSCELFIQDYYRVWKQQDSRISRDGYKIVTLKPSFY